MPSIQPVVINVNVGLADFKRDIKTIEQALINLEKLRIKSSTAASKASIKADKDSLKSTLDSTKQEAKAVETSEKKKLADIARGVKAHEKAEKDKTRATEREAKAQQAAYLRTANAIMASIKRQAEAESRALEAAGRARRQFGEKVAGRTVNGIARGAHAAMGLATAAIGVMGGFTLADSVHERANMHGLAKTIAIQGSQEKGQQFTGKQVLDTATAEGIRSGRGTEETLKGLRKFIDITGDLKAGQDNLKMISDYADAAGASLEDMSTAAAELFASKTVKNAKELGTALGVFTEMGKGGAVELKDFAKGFAKITSTAAFFGGVGKMENAFTLGAVGEVSKRHGGSQNPVTSMTSVQRFGSDIFQHADKLKSRLGVDIKDKHGDIRSAQDILVDIVSATKGDRLKLNKLFNQQGIRGVLGSVETYKDAIKSGSTPAQATAAVRKELTDLSSGMMSTEKAATIAAERRAEADRQFAIVTEKLKVALGERLLPEVLKLVPELTKLVPTFVDLLSSAIKLGEWLAKNPFIGLGTIVAGFLLKELAAAFVIEKAKMAVGGALGGSAGGGVKLAGAGIAALAGIAGGAQTASNISGALDATHESIMSDIMGTGEFAIKSKKHTATTDDIKNAKAKLAQMESAVKTAGTKDTSTSHMFATGVLSSAQGAANMLTMGNAGTSKMDEAKELTSAKAIQDSKALIASIDMLRKAIEGAGPGITPPEVNGPNREAPIAQRGGSNGR